MKKSLVALFCIGFCVTLAFLYPQVGSSYQTVNDTGCLTCHDASYPGGSTSLHVIHTGQACTICHVDIGDTPATSKCVVCHPTGDPGTCNLVNFHDPAVADCLTCHSECAPVSTTTTTAGETTTTTSVPGTAEVAISPAAVNLAPGSIQSFQASTTGGDNTPVYTWDLSASGGTADTTTGDTIQYLAGPTAGSYTVKVTDTANGNIEATAAIVIGELCAVKAVDESIPKSHWVALPALIRIQTAGFEVSQATKVTFTSDADGALQSVIPLVKLVNPNTGIINQFALILPAILTGNLDAESETVTVAVAGCDKTGTFELKILSLGPIPLNK